MKRIFALLLFVALAKSGVAQTIYRYTCEGVLFQPVGSSIAFGDPFTFSFTLNYDAVDTDPFDNSGTFANAVSDLSFSLKPTATGTYLGGTMTGPAALNVSVSAFSSVLRFDVNSTDSGVGVSFADAGAAHFNKFDFHLDAYASLLPNPVHFSSTTGDRLGDVIPLINGNDYNSHIVDLVFDSASSQGAFTSVSAIAIPEPATLAVAFGVCAMAAALRFRRVRKNAATA